MRAARRDLPALTRLWQACFGDTEAEVRAWLDRQLRRYEETGAGLWAVVRRDTGEMIGQCGLTWQPVPENSTFLPCSKSSRTLVKQSPIRLCTYLLPIKRGKSSVCVMRRWRTVRSGSIAAP